jgi:hypothetical protein
MLEYVEDDNERKLIKSKPSQVKASHWRINVLQELKKKSFKEGQKIWYAINEYVELVESTRFEDDETPHMNTFLSGSRRGIVDKILLNKMNQRCLCQ